MMTLRTLTLGELDTNCYVLWDENRIGLIVDPADDVQIILALVESERLKIEAVVLTHAHFDHMLAAEALCEATDAPLCVGQGDAAALQDPVRNLSGVFQMCPPISVEADRTLCEGDVLTVGGLTFTVLETPGHTPGCICLMGEDVLLSGDTLFYDSIGRVDFPGGDVPAMLASLRRLATLPETLKVYSGHGPATTIGREVNCNPYMLQI